LIECASAAPGSVPCVAGASSWASSWASPRASSWVSFWASSGASFQHSFQTNKARLPRATIQTQKERTAKQQYNIVLVVEAVNEMRAKINTKLKNETDDQFPMRK
jgi:hypothetical protein